jgi:nucleoside-diphosphate-sugar epimerase
MPVLVTGSSGQLGQEIARQLASDDPVLGLDERPGPRTTHVGSIGDAELVARLVDQVDAVVHAAGNAAVEETRVLVEAAAARGHRRFVLGSSTSVYGGAAGWITEEVEPAPLDEAAGHALAIEALCHRITLDRGLPVTVLRTAPCSPDEPELVAASRLFCGIDPRDAAAAHVAALIGGVAGFTLVNVSARSPFGLAELADLRRDAAAVIARHDARAPAAFAAHGWRLPASIDRVIAAGRAESVLGWRARHGLDSLLRLPGRWLYHLFESDRPRSQVLAPASLGREGFVHCSFRGDVTDSARLHFPPGARLHVLRIDPRRLGAAVEEAPTPRGPMPHVFGPIRPAAVVEVLQPSAIRDAPDEIERGRGDRASSLPRTTDA